MRPSEEEAAVIMLVNLEYLAEALLIRPRAIRSHFEKSLKIPQKPVHHETIQEEETRLRQLQIFFMTLRQAVSHPLLLENFLRNRIRLGNLQRLRENLAKLGKVPMYKQMRFEGEAPKPDSEALETIHEGQTNEETANEETVIKETVNEEVIDEEVVNEEVVNEEVINKESVNNEPKAAIAEPAEDGMPGLSNFGGYFNMDRILERVMEEREARYEQCRLCSEDKILGGITHPHRAEV